MESAPRHRGSYKFPAFSSPLHPSVITTPLSSLPPSLPKGSKAPAASALLCTVHGQRQQSLSCEPRAAAAAMERPAQAPRQLPPGFRFHPTDEELVVQYLRRKAMSRPLPAAVIPVVDDDARLNPWELPGASEGEGYFFSLRRSPAAGRRRRAGSGYWKATGKEKPVFLQCGGRRQLLVGVKTALAFFHRGEPSSSSLSRTGWVMHEYRLAVHGGATVAKQSRNASQDCVFEPGEWVVCRVFLKNRPRSRPNRDIDGKTPGNHAFFAHLSAPLQHREDARRQQPLMLMSPQPSSSSCVTGVTDISDQDEVSSSSIRDAPAASQRGV